MSAQINYEIDSIIEQLNRLKHAVQLNCRNANTSAIELLPSRIKLSSKDSSNESRKKSPRETPKKERFRITKVTNDNLEESHAAPAAKLNESPTSPSTAQPKKSRFTVKYIPHKKGGKSRRKQ